LLIITELYEDNIYLYKPCEYKNIVWNIVSIVCYNNKIHDLLGLYNIKYMYKISISYMYKFIRKYLET